MNIIRFTSCGLVLLLAVPAWAQTEETELTIPEATADPVALGRALVEGRRELFEAMRAAHPELADEAERVADEAEPLARDAERQARRRARQARPERAPDSEPTTFPAADPAALARELTERIGEEPISARRLRHWRTLAGRLGLDPESARPDAIPADMRAELRRHAQRVARLAELRSVAQRVNDGALVPRIDRLVTREYARHESALGRINGSPLLGLADALGSSVAGTEE